LLQHHERDVRLARYIMTCNSSQIILPGTGSIVWFDSTRNWFVVVALFFVTATVVLQKALGRIFVMVRLCHSNDFGSL
jgi:hypothetical protein